jgi:4-amino-4-deoxy-L-arabinose transferase-like glycosyltransferase
VLSSLLHGLFAFHQPFTNDEGAYLYDARTLLIGSLSGGDTLTKTPVVVMLFATSEFITRHSLFAARLINILCSMLTAWPLYIFMRRLIDEKTARYGAILWLLGAGPIVMNSLGHTQAIATFFMAATLAAFISKRILSAGLLFVLAWGSRKIGVVLLVPLLLLMYMRVIDIQTVRKRSFFVGIAVILLPYLFLIYWVYGSSGIGHALGASYTSIISEHVLGSEEIVSWGGGLERFSSVGVRIGLTYILILVTALTLIVRNLFSGKKGSVDYRIAVPVGYLAALAFLYFLWPILLPEYLGDFLLPLTMIGACIFRALSNNTIVYRAAIIVVSVATVWSLASIWRTPWTGMFSRTAITEAATWLQEHVPKNEQIFTAAVIIPYMSGHSVPFHISHPQWYQYSFISQEDKRVFLPSKEALQDELATHVSWAILDQLSDYSYPGILNASWQPIHVVSNTTIYRVNPLRVYLKHAI